MLARQTLYLIDASGFIFRAFHALPPLTRSDGTPVGAVMGFCNILLRTLDEAGDALIAIVFDAKRDNFRYQIYPEYKANRSETPPELVPQFPLVREATQAFGLCCIEQEGYEADDLIAAYTKAAVAENMHVRIISADKDLMQLVDETHVRLVDPLKFNLIGPEQVMEKFSVTPDKVVDVQALAGDSSDNVPGVPGIGVKTAAELLNHFGTLEELLARTAEIKQPKRREALEQNADKARISKKLVQLASDMALPLPMDKLEAHKPDSDRLIPFLQAQGFRSLISRIEKKWGPGTGKTSLALPVNQSAPVEVLATDNTEKNYTLVDTKEALDAWVEMIREAGIVAIDTETNSLTPAKADLVGISLSVPGGKACYIPVGHVGDTDLFAQDNNSKIKQLDRKVTFDALRPIFADAAILKVAQNLKYDWQMFSLAGLEIKGFDDTMVMSYALDGGKHGHGLDELSSMHLGQQLISYDEIAGKGKARKTFDMLTPEAVKDYAAEDADMCLRLYQALKPRLVTEKRSSIYNDIDKPIIPILAQMEQTGILIDPEVLKNLSTVFAQRMAESEKKIFEHAGLEFNLASPKQMGDVLFNHLGLASNKTTKTGAFSTDARTLEELSLQGHAIVDEILNWRQLSKLKSTYTDALQEQINPRTGRVHTSFTITVTNTGRLSSTDPNLQNIPIRTEEGRLIRTAFVAPKGHKILSVDYSQIELRLIAEMAGIDRLKQAFHDNIDIHALTASEVFGIPIAEMTSERRRAAKAINFGIIYGISGFGLGKQLGTDPGTANSYIKLYMQRFPELADYMAKTKAFVKQNGFVLTQLGRPVYMPGILSKNGAERAFAERQAINAPIQGTAADIMKLAMVAVDRVITEKNLPAKLLLQVHDELVLEVTDGAAEQVAKEVKHAMENVVSLGVPIVAEAGIGPNWDEAH